MKLWSPRSLIARPRRRVLPPIFGGSPLLAGPFQSQWDSTIPYVEGNITFDRGGWWMRTALNPGTTNSRPISGNTDWTLVAGTPYVDVVADPVSITAGPFFQATPPIGTGVVAISAPGTGLTVIVTGYLTNVTEGDIWSAGSAGNLGYGILDASAADGLPDGGLIQASLPDSLADAPPLEFTYTALTNGVYGVGLGTALSANPGIAEDKPIVWWTQEVITGGSRSLLARIFYTIIPSSPASGQPSFYSITAVDQTVKTFTVSGDATSLGATFAVVGNTGGNDGTYTKTSTDHAAKAITGVNQGTKKFTVAGDQTARFPAGVTATVAGSTGNNGDYTVVAAVFGVATEIEVVEAIPDPTADGTITANTTAIVVVEAIPFATADGWVKKT